jgi:hypothetical protein
MVIKVIKLFNAKAFQNVPKLGVWFENKPSATLPTYQKMLLLKRFELCFIYKGLISRKVGAKTL